MALPPRLSALTRMVFDLGKVGHPSVPMLGRYNYTHANPPLVDHRHADAVEICLLVRGRQTYSVGGQRFRLHGGDVFITYPDEVHGTDGTPEEKGLLYWLSVLDPIRTKGSLLGLPAKESKVLWAALLESKRRHFCGTAAMRVHLDEVLRAVQALETPLRKISLANQLLGFLLEVVAARNDDGEKVSESRFAKVLAHVAEHLAEPDVLDVGSLARIAELSVSRFKTRFKAEFGVPPAEYVLRARVEEARRRLARPGATVTDVALDLGFSSSQYFATSFKRLTHSTPSGFRR